MRETQEPKEMTVACTDITVEATYERERQKERTSRILGIEHRVCVCGSVRVCMHMYSSHPVFLEYVAASL